RVPSARVRRRRYGARFWKGPAESEDPVDVRCDDGTIGADRGTLDAGVPSGHLRGRRADRAPIWSGLPTDRVTAAWRGTHCGSGQHASVEVEVGRARRRVGDAV